MADDDRRDMLAEALTLAARGVRVFPVWEPGAPGVCACPKGEACGSKAKHPRTATGFKEATTDEAQIRRWWAAAPNANIGAATGEKSGLFVLDEDGVAGAESLHNIELEHDDLPKTLIAISGREGGGRHLYFTHPGGAPIGNSSGALGEGLDVRGDGGYVVAPPSMHASGRRYAWDMLGADWHVAPPDWLVSALRKPARANPAPVTFRPIQGDERSFVLDRASKYLTRIPGAISGQGGHPDTFVAVLHMVRGFALGDTADAYDLLAGEYNPRCDPPWSERELRHKITDAANKGDMPWGLHLQDDQEWSARRRPTNGAAHVNGVAAPEPPPRAAPALFDLPDMPPFPVDALPSWLAAMVHAVALETETPPDLAAMMGLASLAMACSRRFLIEPRENYTEPLNLYTMVVLGSGNRKSAVFKRMTAPAVDVESECAEQARVEIKMAIHKREMLEMRIKNIKDRIGKLDDPEDIRTRTHELEMLVIELDQMPPAVYPRLFVQDVTTEKLAALLADHGRIAVMDDEGGLFETMAGRYSKGGAPNMDPYLKGHDGGALRVDRMSRGEIFVRNPALTIGMTVQPDVLRGMGDKQGFRSRGLTARFLYSLPISRVGSRTLDTPTAPDHVVATYDREMRAMLLLPVADPMPRLRFDASARAAWFDFARDNERARGSRGSLGNMADWASKLDGAVARIAGLLHVASGAPSDQPIDVGTVANAVTIGAYLIDHARAAHGELGMDPIADKARAIVEWIRAGKRTGFTRRDLLRANAGGVQKRDDLDPVLDLLHSRGIIVPIGPVDPSRPGRPSSALFSVDPSVLASESH